MEKGISVIICCYNSAKTIGLTLQHIAKQQTGDLPAWEVILVDNNCTDDTVAIATDVWQRENGPMPLRIIKEPEAGLIYARKHGVNNARYEFMIFCDDDNFLAPDYLELAYNIMTANPRIGALGGKAEGYFDTKPPVWFTPLQDNYAVGTQFRHTGDITAERGHVWGAGMISRTALMKEVLQGTFTTTGRKGASFASGDDTEISHKIIEHGYELHYDDRLFYQHYITEKRLTWPYVIKLGKGITQATYMLLPMKRRLQKIQYEGTLTPYKDLLYLIWYNFKLKYLFQIRKIMALEKHEGDMELWKGYFALYHMYCFFRIIILKKE